MLKVECMKDLRIHCELSVSSGGVGTKVVSWLGESVVKFSAGSVLGLVGGEVVKISYVVKNRRIPNCEWMKQIIWKIACRWKAACFSHNLDYYLIQN